ncbi:uncharacterized protein BDW47DRAFT_77880 [Aspergillus candidus]|uniref:ZW10 C-terminal helical domain-containing protein n=1 Tax=Aspergillus candidus TaxID=41067 RepID=A0A2I2F1A7_ASPCN|nr:hypothetical protein BDW47DRAFT_77880 [Aspergillus candidus]PLB34411.1 hypothetical protein BDW47DRAFT_77880 [Aspergillus candidus]
MTSKTSEQEVCQSVLEFVADGTYPASEQVIAAEFPASALSNELELLAKARVQVEAEISSLSRGNDFDADGWISQAKQLHADIERSRVTAREIVAQHENSKPLQMKVEDAAAKVGLVETEIVFNEAVTRALEEVQRLYQQLEAGRGTLREGRVMKAIDTLEEVERSVNQDRLFSNTNVMHVLFENVAELRREIIVSLHTRWAEQLNVDKKQRKLEVVDNNENSLGETISALSRLNLLAAANDKFQNDLISAVVEPILVPGRDGYSRALQVNNSSLQVGPEPSEATVSEVLDRVATVLDFLRQCLPSTVVDPFSANFIPTLSSKVIASWLSSAIPTDLTGLGDFERMLDDVLGLAKKIESLGWQGQEELVSWVNQAPRLWLARRRVDSLDQVRKVLAASQGTTQQVERVEKEQVSQEDDVLLEKPPSDDWDAEWDDDEDDSKAPKASAQDDEEDVSAWGLDDDTKEEADAAADDDDEADAWGWGDEDQEEAPEDPPHKESSATNPANGKQSAPSSNSPKEITLREVYTVTDIPSSILRIVLQQVQDAEAISQPTHSHPRVVSSGAGLLALPTLVLAMFKATASSFYGMKLSSGQMYLYNDSLYLADQIRGIVEEHQLTRLEPDIEALAKFGKFAYTKEMQTQRTIVTDLLDGAQGFGQCSEQPFLGECENAVSAAVDRIRDVYTEWQPILSHSALLQSIGSLVSTIINKMIIDIEDLGDISEPQSQRLVEFCSRVSQLEDLFVPRSSNHGEQEAVPMTAVYVRNWLKFQYLVNILESSLADIKFLWVEGELRLEFSPDEVVDLIEALFAESDYRRKAIAEIRRISRQEGLGM